MPSFSTLLFASLLAGAVGWVGVKAGRHFERRGRVDERPEPDSAGEVSGFKLGSFFLGVLCVIYIVSPIDLLPEAILGPFGLPDDLAALFVAIHNFKAAFPRSGKKGAEFQQKLTPPC